MLVRKNLIIAFLLGTFISGIISFVLSPHAYAHMHSDNSQYYGTYNVELQGNIDGQLQFSYQAMLDIVQSFNSYGGHPFDVCLVTAGDPLTNPATGEIRLNSNTACIPGTIQQVDMTSVTDGGQTSTITLQVDPTTSAMDTNGFNTSGGVAGGYEIIVAGTMQLQFSNGGQSVYGQISVGGCSTGAYNPEPTDTYTATFSGTYSGQ